jgi:SAM-dependent methyltransferase
MNSSVIGAFGRRVPEYLTGRPDYPEALLAHLPDAAMIVDLGAGTGKFTHLLARTGARILAVEPQPAMAAHIPAPGNIAVVAGTAEQLPLATGCADLLCCATAFHWFDYPRATAEIERVLKPRGHLALVWNIRDDRTPWVAELTRLLDAHASAAHRRGKGHWHAILSDLRFEHLDTKEHCFVHPMPVSGILDRVFSTSFISALPDARQEAIRERVGKIIEAYPELTGAGEIHFPYIAKLYLLRKRQTAS